MDIELNYADAIRTEINELFLLDAFDAGKRDRAFALMKRNPALVNKLIRTATISDAADIILSLAN